MHFNALIIRIRIDQQGYILYTVHFPEVAHKYPFYGKGIYRLTGIVSEEFGYYTLEVGMMTKEKFMEDVRFSEGMTGNTP